MDQVACAADHPGCEPGWLVVKAQDGYKSPPHNTRVRRPQYKSQKQRASTGAAISRRGSLPPKVCTPWPSNTMANTREAYRYKSLLQHAATNLIVSETIFSSIIFSSVFFLPCPSAPHQRTSGISRRLRVSLRLQLARCHGNENPPPKPQWVPMRPPVGARSQRQRIHTRHALLHLHPLRTASRRRVSLPATAVHRLHRTARAQMVTGATCRGLHPLRQGQSD